MSGFDLLSIPIVVSSTPGDARSLCLDCFSSSDDDAGAVLGYLRLLARLGTLGPEDVLHTELS